MRRPFRKLSLPELLIRNHFDITHPGVVTRLVHLDRGLDQPERQGARPRGHPGFAATADASRLGESRWKSFVIGTQVVKVRSSLTQSAGGGPLLGPIDGVDGFTLNSVSRRDGRIGQVDIWSSRNQRGACLGRRSSHAGFAHRVRPEGVRDFSNRGRAVESRV